MKMIRAIIRLPLNLIKLVAGGIQYVASGKNPAYAYQGMIGLFCTTKGYSSDFLSYLISLVKKPYVLPDANGVLGNFSRQDLEKINVALNDKGYYVFEQRLPDQLCDALLNYALNATCRITVNPDGTRAKPERLVKYNREKPEGLLYFPDVEGALNDQAVQSLLADKSIISVAQAYLSCQPVMEYPSYWWSTAASTEASLEAAQYYHFDMDRIKWLKFFVYLTDVSDENGPHTFISGSQRSGAIPAKLLSQGYARLTDEMVESCYKPEDVIRFTAPRGTVIAEDTRGLHKGTHVQKGDRLMLQFQFSNSHFGAVFPSAYIKDVRDPSLAQMIREYPLMYSMFLKP